MLKMLALLLRIVNSELATAAETHMTSEYSASVMRDANLNVVPLVSKYGYPIETHYITTEDNYILGVHRLPRPKAPVILLMHGLLDSSATWFVMGPWSSLGYYLYDQGYDVWLGNARGNYYSRNHTTLNPSTDKSFWKFTWHEIGYYDLPAMIDYVLYTTKEKKLGYVGHSQGTTSFFVMTSERPEYNAKISMMSALAPVAYMKHIKAPLLFLVRQLTAIPDDNLNEFLPLTDLILNFCFSSKMTEKLCIDFIYQIVGEDPKMWNASMIPIAIGHLPSGCNFKQIAHYLQLVDSGRFCQFDHGPKENMRRYGQPKPKDYAVEKITAPIGLYYTSNDFLTSEVDVKAFAKKLPNVVDDVMFKVWNHMTVIWGVNAREQLHKRMLAKMRQFK